MVSVHWRTCRLQTSFVQCITSIMKAFFFAFYDVCLSLLREISVLEPNPLNQCDYVE